MIRRTVVITVSLLWGLGCGGGTPGKRQDAAADSATPGADASASVCSGLPSPSLDELWADYFAPGTATGCAVAGCHATGTGGFSFKTAHEMWQAAVGKPAMSGGGLLRIKPGDPEHSYLYRKLLPSAEKRMPNGGPYLSDAAIARIAGYICGGAKEPATRAPDAGSDASVVSDAGVDSGTDAAAPAQAMGPSITGFTPSDGLVGTMVMLMGSGFSNNPSEDLVSFNGVSATVLSASPTLLVVIVPALATTGPIRVEVMGQAAQSADDFQVIVTSPVPTLSSVSPPNAVAGSGDLVIAVSGTGFATVSVVELDGAMIATSYQSDTALSAVIPASALTVAGNHTLTVTTRGPGGGTSAGVGFVVDNPLPALSTLAPPLILVGSASFVLTVTGSGFVALSQITLNGAPATTTFTSATELSATVPDALLSTLGAVQVAVINPAPGGGTSSSIALPVGNPVPVLSSVSPGSALAGSGALPLTLDGSLFVAGSVVQIDGASLTTTVNSPIQLSASVDPAITGVAGSHDITVVNPGPGGGTSGVKTLVINNPVPSVTSIDPSNVATHGAVFTLTVTGSNFNASSVVQFVGSPIATTFVSASTLQAQVASIDTDGSYAITVSNPAPGGGSSGSASLTATTTTAPTITGLSPSSAQANTPFVLTVSGSGYACAGTLSQLLFNGAPVTISSCSATELQGSIPATAGGSYSVQVRNASADSNIASFAIIQPNPVPSLSSLSPNAAIAGGAAFTLTVHGSNFVSGAVVSWNGNTRSTTFVDATQVTASIPPSDIAAAGDDQVTVTNPAPGGGQSAALTFSVSAPNPAPVITGLSPASVDAGSGAVSVRITGTGFIPASTAAFNGSARTSSYVSATALDIALTSADTQSAANDSITVTNPAPGGGTSGAFTFVVAALNPAPALSSLSPTSALVGGAAFMLTINGSGFVPTSTASWNGVAKSTAYVSATQLTASISTADIATANAYPVSVTNPAPGGGTSGSLSFQVNNPVPSVSTIAPSMVTAGSGAFSLTVSGAGFVNGSSVAVDGSARTTHFVSSAQITADLLAGDDSAPTTHSITVVNPSPGGGTSGGVTLTVASQPNPVPVISSLTPCGAVAGSGAFTLTVNGSMFVAGATATFNGTAVTTSFVGATQLTLAIPASLITTAPTNDVAPVIVSNPTPSLGPSTAVNFGVATQTSTLANNVQAIFTASCTSCHKSGTTAPMSLVSGQAYASLVGVNATRNSCTGTKRVLACGPLRTQSVLVDKIGPSPICGARMPKGGTPLSTAQQQLIIDWVAQGAPP